MTSKEALNNLKEINRKQNNGNGDIWLESTIIEPIEKDLEDYEKLKKLMGMPIQDIMKRLKVLEILKPNIELFSDGIISCHNIFFLPYYEDYEEQYNLLKEWLDGKD